MRKNYEDWGDDFDDMDGADFEDMFGGPDDENEDEEEIDYEDWNKNEQDDDSEEGDFDNYEKGDDEDHCYDTARQNEIVNWLITSNHAIKLKKREGYYLSRGQHIRISDGSTVEMFKWLYEEGIKNGIVLEEYSVFHKINSDVIIFFKIIDDPFVQEYEEPPFNDEDIPF